MLRIEEIESAVAELPKAIRKTADKNFAPGFLPCLAGFSEEENGAGDGNRTRDQRLGRPRLYH